MTAAASAPELPEADDTPKAPKQPKPKISPFIYSELDTIKEINTRPLDAVCTLPLAARIPAKPAHRAMKEPIP